MLLNAPKNRRKDIFRRGYKTQSMNAKKMRIDDQNIISMKLFDEVADNDTCVIHGPYVAKFFK